MLTLQKVEFYQTVHDVHVNTTQSTPLHYQTVLEYMVHPHKTVHDMMLFLLETQTQTLSISVCTIYIGVHVPVDQCLDKCNRLIHVYMSMLIN